MNYNDRNDTYINDTLNHLDVSNVIGLLRSHTIPQDNESSKLTQINMSVYNVDNNVDYCYINSSTGYESNNHSYVHYTNKGD